MKRISPYTSQYNLEADDMAQLVDTTTAHVKNINDDGQAGASSIMSIVLGQLIPFIKAGAGNELDVIISLEFEPYDKGPSVVTCYSNAV